MVTAAMKLKDAYSLEGNMTNLNSIFKSRDITLPTKVCLVNTMRLCINYKIKTVRNTSTWKLNNTFLNNQQVTEESKGKSKKF